VNYDFNSNGLFPNYPGMEGMGRYIVPVREEACAPPPLAIKDMEKGVAGPEMIVPELFIKGGAFPGKAPLRCSRSTLCTGGASPYFEINPASGCSEEKQAESYNEAINNAHAIRPMMYELHRFLPLRIVCLRDGLLHRLFFVLFVLTTAQ
jgi:hypothetical protein